MSRYMGLFQVIGFVLMAAVSHPASAGQPPLREDGEINIGPIVGYTDETAAKAACRPDAVVWADSKTGLYFPKFAEEFGATPNGTYTCYKQAERSNYWGSGPMSTMADRGRVFPMTPGPSCDYKIDKKTHKGFCAEPGA